MCGICGQISYTENLLDYKEYFYNMQNRLFSRGPDQHGEYFSENAVLMHRRLSVIDIEHGKQPMTYAVNGEMFTICYNGELYNTLEIRNRLESCGYNFFSHSDTEVVLKAYCEYRESCVNLFNGIFAFAVYEHENKRLFFARDRMGVKPLFYSIENNGFIFASEIKALLEHPAIKPEIDVNSLAEIMLIGPGRTPGYGVFRGIKEVCPACCGFYDKDGIKIWKYWDVEAREHTDNVNQTIETVRSLVTDSIKRQLISDVPLGTFLSGGLDSSIISSVANLEFKARGEVLHTFSVDYVDNDKYFKKSKFQPNSDPEYIRIMAKYLDCEHHWIMIDTDELVKGLYDSVDARDLPGMADVDSSMLILCKHIKEYNTVAVSGECSDEIFGGYPWYRDKTIRMTDGFPWAQSTLYRAGFLKDEYSELINPEEYVYSRYDETVKQTKKRINMNETDSRMAEMMKLNLDWFMQNLLERKDRMSMYSSLEVRVPFCDYRIVEYLYNIPWEMKDYKNYEKGLLRQAMTGYLPDEVLWRKKSPYPKTHNPSYLNAVSQKLNEIINDNNSPLLEFIKKEKLTELLHSDNAQPWYGQLMTTPQTIAFFIQFDYWLKKYNVSFIQ
ncbi:MAG: asparagine synthase (glutamine-hydrolyzing) [Ruminococcus sp.]|nr:asparagine synthase (glutamine-hydrolyzing) [Candidatus Copronaster equi]